MIDEPLECIDCHAKRGVTMQSPGYGVRLYARCDRCAEARVAREQENRREGVQVKLWKVVYRRKHGIKELDAPFVVLAATRDDAIKKARNTRPSWTDGGKWLAEEQDSDVVPLLTVAR